MNCTATRRLGSFAVLCAAALMLALAVCGDAAYAQEAPPDTQGQAATDAARAHEALAEANRLYEAGRWEEAARLYSEAYRLLPEDDPAREQALQGMRLAQQMLDQATTIEDVEEDLSVLRQRALVEFDNAKQEAQQLLGEGDFEGAKRALLLGQLKLDQARPYLSESKYVELNEEADALQTRIDEQQELQRLQDLERARLSAEEEQRRQEEIERYKRQETIDENLRRVRQLQAELKYDEALQVIDEILFIDEHNPAALALQDALEASKLYREYMEVQRIREGSYPQLSVENMRATIAPVKNLTGPGPRSTTGVMHYPEDWPQLSLRRGHDTGWSEAPENQVVLRRLAETSIPVDFTNISLENSISFLGQVTGLEIWVNWRALEMAGLGREEEITLDLKEVSVEKALDKILEQVGDEFSRPQWAVEEGILVISSDEALRRKTTLVVYDIRDLLFQVPMFDNAPDLDIGSALNQGGGGMGGGGGGGGFGGGGGGGMGGGGGGGFGGGGGGGGGGSIFGDPGDEPDRLTREELVEQIVTIIQDEVDYDGWRLNGGSTGSLQELNGNLIIRNTARNHRDIEGLLAQLREIRALQINVECRFLDVSTDWFEQIGVDLDLYFNTNNSMYRQGRASDPFFQLGDFFDDAGRLKDPVLFDSLTQTNFPPDDDPGAPGANTIAWGQLFGIPTGDPPTDIAYIVGPVGSPVRNTGGWSPIGVTQNSLDTIGALATVTDFGKNILAASPAVSIGLQFLDDIQVDLLIEATQADRRSVVLTAPRLTFFNGQRAWVAVTTSSTYVSGLQAVTGDSSGAFQPQLNVLREGFVLDVEGVISADRRYVTMTVLASLAQAGSLENTAQFQGAAGGGGQGGGEAAQFEATIQLPEIDLSLVQTTVSVPDRGTIMLGGQRLVKEYEVETGVPVLSKIPFLNRFFTNRITNKEEQTLLVLIRPEIIIQQENEDLLFPGLSDQLGGAPAYLR